MRTLLIILSILTVQVGCEKANVADDNDDVFPNKVGDTWTYLVDDTSYLLFGPPTITQYTLTVSVVDTITLPDGVHAKVWAYNSPTGRDTNYVFQRSDTVFFTSKHLSVYMDIIRRYIIPFALNNSWAYSWISPPFAPYPVIVTVVSRSNITVGGNTFENASHIVGRTGKPDDILGLDEWVATNVGIVKRYVENTNTINPYKYRNKWSLVSYHLE